VLLSSTAGVMGSGDFSMSTGNSIRSTSGDFVIATGNSSILFIFITF
jgi:hypothetical protein